MATRKENPLLVGIYKRGQCLDENDFLTAINSCERVARGLANRREQSRAVYIRWNSLLKGYRVLMEKSVRGTSRADIK